MKSIVSNFRLKIDMVASRLQTIYSDRPSPFYKRAVRGFIILTYAIVVFFSTAFTSVGNAQEVARRVFLTPDGKRPTGLFAPGVMINDIAYIAGKGDYRPQGNLAEKVENCLNEIELVLKQHQMTRKNIVKSFCYLEDPSWYDEFNVHYAKFFGDHAPARTTIAVPHVPGDSRIEITCIACADPSKMTAFGPPAPGARPYSSAMQGGDMIFLSGRGDQLADNSHPNSFEEQVRQTMRNVQAGLTQAKADFPNIVMSHIFVDDPANVAIANRIHDEFFTAGNGPARSTAVVEWIPGGSHVEITCIATTNLAQRKPVRVPGLEISGSQSASPAIWAGSTLFVSNAPEWLRLSNDQKPDVKAQVQTMAQNHTKILEASGLQLSDIIAGWVYLADIEEYNAMNDEYRKFYSAGPGVRTTLMPNSKSGASPMRFHATFIAAKSETR